MGTAAGAIPPHAAARRTSATRRALAAPLTRRAAFLVLLASVPLLPLVTAEPFDYPALVDPWVYLPLGGLCALVLLDGRALRSWRSLDLLAFLSLALSLACWRAWRMWPTFLLYAALACLALRMLAIAGIWRRGAGGDEMKTRVPAIPRSWLAVGIALLTVVHVAWALEGRARIDVGEAGLYGAHALVHGQPLYAKPVHAKTDAHLDTYGPVNYLAYVPFLALAHGYDVARITTVFFDLLTALLLFLLGRRLRGPTAGTLLAFCWLAFPLTFYGDMLAFNDSILAATVVGTLLASRRPLHRGAAASLAAWTKLSPFALVPLLACYSSGEQALGSSRPRTSTLRFAAGFALATLVVFAPVLPHDSIATFLSRTVGFQAGRAPSLSLWGQMQDRYATSAAWLGTASSILHGVLVALTGTLALMIVRLPRRRDLVGLAAACAAIMVALVASLGYFSYSYLLWFAPLVLVVLALDGAPVPRPAGTNG